MERATVINSWLRLPIFLFFCRWLISKFSNLPSKYIIEQEPTDTTRNINIKLLLRSSRVGSQYRQSEQREIFKIYYWYTDLEKESLEVSSFIFYFCFGRKEWNIIQTCRIWNDTRIKQQNGNSCWITHLSETWFRSVQENTSRHPK